MKHILTAALCAVLAATSLFAQKTPVVLVADVNRLYQDYEKAKEARERFESAVKDAEMTLEEKLKSHKSMTEGIQTLRETLGSDAISDQKKAEITSQVESKISEIRLLENEINDFRQKSQDMLRDRRNSILQLHFNEIKEIVKEVAKEKGADIVLNSAGAGVVYFDEAAYDITDVCLKRLNVAKAAAPEAAPKK